MLFLYSAKTLAFQVKPGFCLMGVGFNHLVTLLCAAETHLLTVFGGQHSFVDLLPGFVQFIGIRMEHVVYVCYFES